jgi:3'-phosphoadenosine 5'-phosphosulfate sulfotransferase (PAPS reductase)/FAD synthetase
MMRILSLGAGIQSTVLLEMSITRELPKLDCAIFADTQYEPPAVYTHLKVLKAKAEAAGIPVHTVSVGDLRHDAIEIRSHRVSSDGKRYASIPLFILNPDGSQGRVRRQCTSEYKIIPIERFIKREILGYKPGARLPREILVELNLVRTRARRTPKPARLALSIGSLTPIR